MEGITVFLGMSLVITPPTVSIPSVSGVTSKRRISADTVQAHSVPLATQTKYILRMDTFINLS